MSFDKKKYDKYLIELQKKADEGDPQSAYEFAQNCFFNKQDYINAYKYYYQAAENGHTMAQVIIGEFKMFQTNYDATKINYEEAKKWFKKAASQGNAKAQCYLGDFARDGLAGEEPDYKKSKMYYELAIKKGNIKAKEGLGFLHLFGWGVEQSFKKAKELFLDSYNYGNFSIKYYVDVFEKIGNKRIKIIDSIAEYIGKDIEEDIREGIGGIFIRPEKNSDENVNILYDIESFKKIKEFTESFLENIPMVNDDNSNVLSVVEAICKKGAELIKYGYDEGNFSSCSLIGMLKGQLVCAGYSEFFRNMCACRNISCINIFSDYHVFSQLKIGNKWYDFCYTAFANQNLSLNIEEWLLSSNDIRYLGEIYIPRKGQFTNDSLKSFRYENIVDIVGRRIMTTTSEVKSATQYMNGQSETLGIDNNLVNR